MEESIYLVVGCHGRKEDEFTLCSSLENRILKLDESLLELDDIWSYLEGVRLLDRPLVDLNAVRNLVYRMQAKFDQRLSKLWSEKEFHCIERFMHMHKSCGLYMKLEICGQLVEVPHSLDNVVLISGTPAETPAKPSIVRNSRR